MVIVRIKYFDKITRKILFFHCLIVIPAVERIQLKLLLWLCIPDHQRIYNMVSVSDDRHIIRNCKHRLIIHMLKFQITILIGCFLHTSAKFHLITVLRSAKFERITVLKPGVRYFYLESVDDLLLKHTVTVADSTAVSCISKCCKRIHKAGSQTSESAVSKCRIRLLILNNTQI